MANPEHLAILKKGVGVWNEWREQNLYIKPDLEGAQFVEGDPSDAYFPYARSAWAHPADFNVANFNMTNLREADLRGADLIRARLIGADLMGADLVGADLTLANLTMANLTMATLVRVSFSDAQLEESNFSSARMWRTVLAGVDLSTARGLDQVEHLGHSTIGIDTLYRSKGMIPEIFLKGAGVPDEIIDLQATLRGKPIEFYSVFISYSHADKSFARRLYDGLQGRGIRCWLDEHEILPGQKIHIEVDRGIRIWDKVLLCCSGHSLTSWWVNNEIELVIQEDQALWKERGEEVLALIPLNLDGYMFKLEWHSGWKGQVTERLAADFTGWE